MHFGLRLRGHLGYGNHGGDLSYYYYYGDTISASVHSLQGGVEASFIWDFLEYKNHTLGWNASPVGFEIAGFFGSVSAGGGESLDLNSYVGFAYMFSSGIHYYYNAKHLVFLTYKYRTYFGNGSANTGNKIGFYVSPYHNFMIGYAYKF